MKSSCLLALLSLSGAALADQFRYTIHTVVDPDSGLKAYHYLLPDGWNASDNISWNKQSRLSPVTFSATLTSPDGVTKIDMLAPETNEFAVKSGNLTGTLPPSKAVDALSAAFAHFHPNAQNAKKDFAQDFEVPFAAGEGVKSIGLCGVLQVTFTENDKPMVMYLSATEYEASKKADNGDVEGTWRIANAFALTAPQADFKKDYTLFASVVSAEGMTPPFLQLMLRALTTPAGTELDVKALAAQSGGEDPLVAQVIKQNAGRHQQATEKMFPIFHNPQTYKTEVGPMLFFGNFAVFASADGKVIVDDSATASTPSGFKKLSAGN